MKKLYATWRSYQMITNMGTNTEMLTYVTPVMGGEPKWSNISSPERPTVVRVYAGGNGRLTAIQMHRIVGARPALYG